jgi:hypothetical protein
VDDELTAAPQLLITELSGLARLLSTGVSALVRAAFHAGEADTALSLGAGKTDIARQLEATGWLDLFEVHDMAFPNCLEQVDGPADVPNSRWRAGRRKLGRVVVHCPSEIVDE